MASELDSSVQLPNPNRAIGIATAAWEFIFWRGRLRLAILRLGIATAASPPRGDASEVVQLEPRAWPDALDEKPDQENISEV